MAGFQNRAPSPCRRSQATIFGILHCHWALVFSDNERKLDKIRASLIKYRTNQFTRFQNSNEKQNLSHQEHFRNEVI
jgi:hypothetical protein